MNTYRIIFNTFWTEARNTEEASGIRILTLNVDSTMTVNLIQERG